MWHVPINTGVNIPSQPTDCTPHPDRSGGISHLKVAGATRQVGIKIVTRVRAEKKDKQIKTQQINVI